MPPLTLFMADGKALVFDIFWTGMVVPNLAFALGLGYYYQRSRNVR
jgi:hypothetical protein